MWRETTSEGNTYQKCYHQSFSLLLKISLHHRNLCQVITQMKGQALLRHVKKGCRPIPILLTIKILKTCKYFQEALEIKTKGITPTAKSGITTAIKTTTGVSTISVPPLGSTTISMFQQEMV